MFHWGFINSPYCKCHRRPAFPPLTTAQQDEKIAAPMKLQLKGQSVETWQSISCLEHKKIIDLKTVIQLFTTDRIIGFLYMK